MAAKTKLVLTQEECFCIYETLNISSLPMGARGVILKMLSSSLVTGPIIYLVPNDLMSTHYREVVLLKSYERSLLYFDNSCGFTGVASHGSWAESLVEAKQLADKARQEEIMALQNDIVGEKDSKADISRNIKEFRNNIHKLTKAIKTPVKGPS